MITSKDVLKYEKLVNNLLKSFLSNQRRDCITDAQELKQVGMIAVYNALRLYNKSKGTFRNYVITAIKHAFNRQRIFDTKTLHDMDDSILDIISDNNDMSENISNKILKDKLTKVINSLPRVNLNTKKILLLRLEGYSTIEIARMLDMSYQNVAQVINNNKDTLRRKLQGEL